MQRMKGLKSIEMIIKMVNEFKLAVVHFASPNPMRMDLLLEKKTVEIMTGPPGHRAVAGRGLLGHRGLYAAGLVLAKPLFMPVHAGT